MIKTFFQSLAKASRLTYMSPPEKPNPTAESAEPVTEAKESGLDGVKTEDVSEKVVSDFKKHHRPDNYKSGLEGLLEDYDGVNKQTVLQDSVKRYTDAYESALNYLKAANNSHLEIYKERVAGIKEVARSETGLLNEAVRRGEAVKKPDWETLEINPEQPMAKRLEPFDKFRAQLDEQYLNTQWEKTHRPNEFSKWKEMSDEFKEGLSQMVQAQVNDIYKNETDSVKIKSALKKVTDDLEQSYKDFANNDGQIDLTNLGQAKAKADEIMELHKKLEGGAENSAIIAAIDPEALKTNPEAWNEAVSQTVNQLLEDAKAAGLEPQIINAAEKRVGATRMDLDEAIDEIKKDFDRRAKADVTAGLRNAPETLDRVKELNNDLNSEQLDARNDVLEGMSIKGMALHERNMLLAGRTRPRTVDDKAMVEFMQANYAKKKDILRTPQKREDLLQAIGNITDEKSAYQVDKTRLKKRKINELVHSPNPDTPTGDDITARKLALLTLAKEAGITVQNIKETNEFKHYHEDMDLSIKEPEKNPPSTNFKLNDNLKLYKTDYQTLASRNGFNGVELGKAALKTWAVLTLVANVMSERKNLMKGDFSGVAKNPFIHISGAALFGLHKINQNPKAGDYFKEGEAGREAIGDETSLNKIAKKHGKAEVAGFARNETEYTLLNELDDKDTAALYKKAGERASKKGEKPEITTEDLKELLAKGKLGDLEEQQLRGLANDPRSARIRYDFYKSFAARGKNTRQLRANAQNWK